ncbi:MAG TPA: LppX_LprAFG lipoprotein [Ilumatobacter sp.]|nr:LppX_LprAFG lipoprotein [Ilumatobacter sp.]
MNDEVLTDEHDNQTTPDRTEWFAWGSLGLAAVALIVVGIIALTGSTGSGSNAPGNAAPPANIDDGAVGDPNADANEVLAASAVAMSEVTSVEFALDQSGAPVYIDQFESIALTALLGQFTVPGEAAAIIDVVIDGNLNTRIGAVALEDEVWISNPVTGTFETLPAGYDIDPSKFFDPTGGWQPLLEQLTDVEMVGVENDGGGDRYHLAGVAPPSEVTNITVGLVRDQAVPVDLWIHPSTSLVTRAEFATVIDGAESNWRLDLAKYGEAFVIERPEGVDA